MPSKKLRAKLRSKIAAIEKPNIKEKTYNKFQILSNDDNIRDITQMHENFDITFSSLFDSFNGKNNLRSQLYILLNSVLYPSISKDIPIGLFIAKCGDAHMGNLARKSNFSQIIIKNYVSEIFYSQAKGNPVILKKTLNQWILNLQKTLEISSILDEKELLDRKFITKIEVEKDDYRSSKDREENDVIEVILNGKVKYFKYALNLQEAQLVKLKGFLLDNAFLINLREKISLNDYEESKDEKILSPVNNKREESKPKTIKEAFFNILLSHIYSNDDSIKYFENFLKKYTSNLDKEYIQQDGEVIEECALILIRKYFEQLNNYGPTLGKKIFDLANNNSLKYSNNIRVILSACYLHGIGTKRDVQEAGEIFNLVSEEYFNHKVCHDLAVRYFAGISVEKDSPRAFSLFERSANYGYSDSEFYLGLCYQYGYGVQRNPQKAFELYKKSFGKGNINAANALGIYIFDELRNNKDAIEFFKIASDAGHQASQYRLGICYKDGLGVKPNLEIAQKFFELSAKQKYMPSLQQLVFKIYCNFKDKESQNKALDFLFSLSQEEQSQRAIVYCCVKYEYRIEQFLNLINQKEGKNLITVSSYNFMFQFFISSQDSLKEVDNNESKAHEKLLLLGFNDKINKLLGYDEQQVNFVNPDPDKLVFKYPKDFKIFETLKLLRGADLDIEIIKDSIVIKNNIKESFENLKSYLENHKENSLTPRTKVSTELVTSLFANCNNVGGCNLRNVEI